ncbi:MAG: glycerol-3-phosphate 1-O-acyltransferase PlsY, partial [Limisphaerales bacterium]
TGFLVAKAKGVDIREVGSGNIGATNVFRILGKAAGIFVLLVDAAKGVLPVLFLPLVASKLDPSVNLEWLKIGCGIGAIMGHNYTCWLRFKGGKGIATSAGVFGALTPMPLLIALVSWIVFFALTRYVSFASIVSAVALPAATWVQPFSLPLRVVTTIIGALAIYKHRANIQRLLAGTEHRVGDKKKEESA